MIYLIGGENNYESTQALTLQIKKYVDEGFAIKSLYIDDEGAIAKISSNTQNINFFSDQGVVVVKAIELATKEQLEQLVNCLAQTAEIILFSRQKLDKRLKLYKYIKETGTVLEFGMLKDRELQNWAQKYMHEIGLNLDSAMVNEILFRVGDDQLLISKELTKLKALSEEGEHIDRNIVKNFVTQSAEVSVWDLIDSLTQKNKSVCYGLLDQLKDTIEYEFIMGMIVRQLRLLYLGALYKDRGQLVQIGIHPFVAGKILKQSQYLNTQRLKRLYEKVVDMEISVKSGRLEKALALDLLVTVF